MTPLSSDARLTAALALVAKHYSQKLVRIGSRFTIVSRLSPAVLFSLSFQFSAILTFAASFFSIRHSATGGNARQIVLTGCVVAARTYLAVFLFSRVLQHGGDSRFVKAKRDWRVFLFFWIMQGVWVFVTVLPMLVTNLTPRRIAMGGKDYAALALVVFGLGFEIVADMQKTAFRSNPHNADKFIDSGLWSVSRHPNVSLPDSGQGKIKRK